MQIVASRSLSKRELQRGWRFSSEEGLFRQTRWLCHALLLCLCAAASGALHAQTAPPTNPAVIASIHNLVLTDGTTQRISRYEIKGNRVRYISAERGGEWEEVPVSLVDWAATLKYAREHTPGVQTGVGAPVGQDEAAALDKEEQAARAEQQARTPEVLPGLRLPEQDGIWALDYFHDQPELVTLVQNSGDVNEQTGHNVLRSVIGPLAGSKQQVVLEGRLSKVRLHIPQPAFYISLTKESGEPSGDALTVDTHGLASKQPKAVSSPSSQYVIVRVTEHKTYRAVSSIQISALGRTTQSQDTVPTTATILPGGHWMKVTPKEPLLIGEYALMEVLSPKEINLAAWDFAIDPQGPENANAILPLQRER